MNPIAIATQGKGVVGMVRRAGTIQSRYGLTPKRMARTLSHFVDLLGEYGCGATFPITTATLARNKGVVEKHQAQQIEFAAHGYYHIDHSKLTFEQQLEHFTAARRLFEEQGVRCDGFRAPYLRTNQHTLAAIKEAGFCYDSSQTLAWDIPAELETSGYRRALGFYGSLPARDYPALPRYDHDLVRIPYCLPDDEAFVDRFQTSAARMTEIWSKMLQDTYARGELFTVALHPERILQCQQALIQALQDARKLRPHVWMSQLYQIAGWWQSRSQAQVQVTRDGEDTLCMEAHGVDGITVLARNVQVTSRAHSWDNQYIEAEGPAVRFRSAQRPFIGVSPASPAHLTSFLRQQGYIVEPAENDSNHSFYVDRTLFSYEDERPLLDEIEQGDFPLIRLGRWPHGARSALCVTGDIDALTIWDYALRLF